MTDRPLGVDRAVAVAAAIACVMLCGYFAFSARDWSHVRKANELGIEGRYERALAEARRVDRAPAKGRALVVEARAAQALGRHRDAVGLFRRAAERDPRSWSLHRDWAISLLALGDREAARRRLDLAGALNPRMPAPPGF